MFTKPSALSEATFVLLCLIIVCALLAGVWLSARREGVSPHRRTGWIALFIALGLLLTAATALSGWTEAQPNPRLAVVFIGSNLLILVVGLSPIGGWLARGVPLNALVGFQAFRLPLELILHSWARSGVLPEAMTWSGSNWDIISGLTALVFAPLVKRRVLFAWIANGVGILLLINVCRVVILTSPLPFAWPVEPRLQLAFHFPFVWIIPVCVGGAIFGHVVLTRALLRSGASLDRSGRIPI